jgi:hypothetical protein
VAAQANPFCREYYSLKIWPIRLEEKKAPEKPVGIRPGGTTPDLRGFRKWLRKYSLTALPLLPHDLLQDAVPYSFFDVSNGRTTSRW